MNISTSFKFTIANFEKWFFIASKLKSIVNWIIDTLHKWHPNLNNKASMFPDIVIQISAPFLQSFYSNWHEGVLVTTGGGGPNPSRNYLGAWGEGLGRDKIGARRGTSRSSLRLALKGINSLVGPKRMNDSSQRDQGSCVNLQKTKETVFVPIVIILNLTNKRLNNHLNEVLEG